jgi:hypothetical protein
MVPIRHPLNLITKYPGCNESLATSKALYTSGAFTPWEVNARNIIVEMKGVIWAQKEWALRDAIGIAYTPYNRVEFNNNQPANDRYPYPNYRFGSDENRNDTTGMLLSGEFAVSASDSSAYLTGLNPGESYRQTYHFALIVAYGVHYRYFRDTSYGATGYFHRPEACNIAGTYYDYAFFKNQRLPWYSLNSWQPTSEELETSGGWDKWLADNAWRRVEWNTPYPSQGCEYPR